MTLLPSNELVPVGLLIGALKTLKQPLVLREVRNEDTVCQTSRQASRRETRTEPASRCWRKAGCSPEQPTSFSLTPTAELTSAADITSSQFSLQHSVVPAPRCLFSLCFSGPAVITSKKRYLSSPSPPNTHSCFRGLLQSIHLSHWYLSVLNDCENMGYWAEV